MNNKIVLILLALVIAASGCVSSEPQEGRQADKTVDLEASGLESDEQIRKFSFEDEGETINCYVYDQHDGYAGMGGMSCIPQNAGNR